MGGANCCNDKAFGAPCSECAPDSSEALEASSGADESVHEEPCSSGFGPACGRSEPGHEKALGFSILSAQSQDLNSEYWQVAAVAETYWRSRGGRGSAESRQDRLVLAGEELAAAAQAPPWEAPAGFVFGPPATVGGGESDPDAEAGRKPPLGEGGGGPWSPDGDPDAGDSPGGDVCCPDPIDFPESIDVKELGPGKRPMPQFGISQPRMSNKLKVTYKGTFTFKPKPKPCLCSCCEFRQIMVANKFELLACTGVNPNPRTTDSPNAGGEEDCYWTFLLLDRTGRPKLGRNGRPVMWEQAGLKTTPPAPRFKPARVVAGPACAGHRKPIPSGVPGARSFPSDARYKECEYGFADGPTQTIPAGCSFKWSWDVKLRIIDTCNKDAIKREATFSWQVVGAVSASGVMALRKKPKGEKAKEKK